MNARAYLRASTVEQDAERAREMVEASLPFNRVARGGPYQ